MSLYTSAYKGDREPDFVNEEGFSWWKQTTHYNAQKCSDLESKKFSWWYVEGPDDTQRHIVLRHQEIVKDTTSLEDVAVFLDCMWIAFCTE